MAGNREKLHATHLTHFHVYGGLVSDALHIELHTHKAHAVAFVHRMGDVRAPSTARLLTEALDRSAESVLNAWILFEQIMNINLQYI